MSNELWQGGLGLGILLLGAKYLLPLLKTTVDASASRQSADATLHNLYKEMLEKHTQLSEDLGRARSEVSRLTQEVSRLMQEVHRLTQALQEKRDE